MGTISVLDTDARAKLTREHRTETERHGPYTITRCIGAGVVRWEVRLDESFYATYGTLGGARRAIEHDRFGLSYPELTALQRAYRKACEIRDRGEDPSVFWVAELGTLFHVRASEYTRTRDMFDFFCDRPARYVGVERE